MIVIRTIQDLKEVEKNENLPKWYLEHLSEFFLLLFTTYSRGVTMEAFSLDGIGEIIALEAKDNPHGLCLPMIPGSPGLTTMEPEYVEKLNLDGNDVYRITFMPDNERMVFVFSEVGQFDADFENWLAEQVEWSDYKLDAK